MIARCALLRRTVPSLKGLGSKNYRRPSVPRQRKALHAGLSCVRPFGAGLSSQQFTAIPSGRKFRKRTYRAVPTGLGSFYRSNNLLRYLRGGNSENVRTEKEPFLCSMVRQGRMCSVDSSGPLSIDSDPCSSVKSAVAFDFYVLFASAASNASSQICRPRPCRRQRTWSPSRSVHCGA